jgi:protein involved in ribonucleotide reduction
LRRLNTSILSIKTNIDHFFQQLKFQDVNLKIKKNQRDIKYEYEYFDLVCDITKQMQPFTQVEENKSFP